jgi:deoxyribonuclease-4
LISLGGLNIYLGAHESISGGIYKSLLHGIDDGAEVVQIFSKNARQFKAKPLTDDEITKFKNTLKETKMKSTASHDAYLINLGSPDDEKWQVYKDAFEIELERAEVLGIPHLIFHPGAHLKKGDASGIKRIIQALDELHEKTQGYKVKSIVETTAGQGTNVGYRFEHVRDIIEGVSEPERMGVCYDTCHTFVAGYDIRDEETYDKTFEQFDEIVGIKKLEAFHLNDAMKPLNSRVDRHDQIGVGEIGLYGFWRLVNDKRFEKVPGYLETPPLPSGENSYKNNLELLKKLRGAEEPPEMKKGKWHF